MKDRFEELVEHLLEKGFFLEEAIELLEKSLITRALAMAGGNQSRASKALGIHRNTLLRKMIEYQLDGKRPRRKPPVPAASVPKTRRKSS